MDKGQVKVRLKNELYLKIKNEAYISGKTVSRYISDRLESSFLPTETAKIPALPDAKIEIKSAVEGALESLKNEISTMNFAKNSGGIDPRFVKIFVENLVWIRLYLLNFGSKTMDSQNATDAKNAADNRMKVTADTLLKEIGA